MYKNNTFLPVLKPVNHYNSCCKCNTGRPHLRVLELRDVFLNPLLISKKKKKKLFHPSLPVIHYAKNTKS